MNNIKVCYTCDNNYAIYTGVSIASILYNASDEDNLCFYIISDNISEDNKQKILDLRKIRPAEINFISLDKSIFNDFTEVKTTSYLPIASFYRLKLASLIQNEDKIIYLDPDIIVNSSLNDLYNTDIENYYCGGVLDIGHKRQEKRLGLNKEEFYINSGVMLINLKKWRNNKAEEQFISNAEKNIKNIRLGDQDLINICFAGNIKNLEKKWNVQVINYCSCSDYSGNFNILHYTGKSKPWKFGSYIPAKGLYFKYLELTSWDKPDKNWHKKSTLYGIFLYIKHRPLFMFRPGFYKYLIGFVFNNNVKEI